MSYLVELVVSAEVAIKAIVNWLTEEADREGSEAVGAVVSSKQLAKALSRAGLWSVPAWAPVKRFYSVARFNPSCDVPRSWQNISGWYQTFADWDTI